MKRLFICMLAMLCLPLTACQNIFSPEAVDPGIQTPTGDEPTLSLEAARIFQFASPKDGDTVAEIVVEGYGSMFIKLFPTEAPMAVGNFVRHAEEGYYDGVKFHRVIADFMIQSGDPTGTGRGGESIYGEPFDDEFSEQLSPYRGALCMANSGANTNGSQFFIVQEKAANVVQLKEYIEYKGYTLAQYLEAGYGTKLTDSQITMFLNYGGAPWLNGHHTVFGQLYDGFDVLDDIAAAGTDGKDVPLTDIVIKTIRIGAYSEE